MDEHYPAAVTHGLRQRGIDVLTVQDAGRTSLPDPDQLAFARTEDRVTVTFDADYLALHLVGHQSRRHRLVSARKIRDRNASTTFGTAPQRCRPRPNPESRRVSLKRQCTPTSRVSRTTSLLEKVASCLVSPAPDALQRSTSLRLKRGCLCCVTSYAFSTNGSAAEARAVGGGVARAK